MPNPLLYKNSSISNNSVLYTYSFCLHTVKCQNSSITNNSVKHNYTVSMSKTLPFQTVQFSRSTQFTSIWPIDRTLSDATTASKSGTGSDGNEEVLYILQSFSITGSSPSHCFVSYPGHSLVGGVLNLCRDAISIFYSPSWLENLYIRGIKMANACTTRISLFEWMYLLLLKTEANSL